MSDFSTGSTAQPAMDLRQIYDLILNDQQAAALEQLKPYVAAHPDDAEGWWLMANAVPDIPSARAAIQNVLRIEPNHVQAKDLMNQLDAAEAEQYFGTDMFSDLPSIDSAGTATESTAADTPDWLKGFGSESDTPDLTPAAATGDIPDWLRAMDANTPSVPIAPTMPTATPAPMVSQVAPGDDLSAWFNAASEAPLVTQAAPPDVAPPEKAGDAAPMPDWLKAAAPDEFGQTRAFPTADPTDWSNVSDQPTATPASFAPGDFAAGDFAAGDFSQTRDLSGGDLFGGDLSNWFDQPAAASPAAKPTADIGQTRDLSGGALSDGDLSNWFDTPAVPAADAAGQNPLSNADLDLSNLFDEPLPSAGSQSVTAEDDLSAWFDTPSTQTNDSTSSEGVADTAESMPDWLAAIGPGSATAQADTSPVPPYEVPELESFQNSVGGGSADDWMTSDDPFGIGQSGIGQSASARTAPIDANDYAPTATIEQDVVPSFVNQGSSAAYGVPRDFSLGDEDALLGAALATPAARPASGIGARTSANAAIGGQAQTIPPIQRPTAPARRFPFALVAALIVLIILAVVFIPRLITQAPPVTSSAVAVVATSEATAEATEAATVPVVAGTSSPAGGTGTSVSTTAQAATTGAAPTGSVATAVPLNTVIAALPSQLSAAGVPTATVAVKNSSIGKAVTVSYCQPFGPSLQKNAYSAMDVLAAQVASFAGQADAIAVEVHGCGSAAPVEYRAVVPVAKAVAYQAGQIDAHAFRASWINQ